MDNLPKTTGIYALAKDSEILYIGKAINLRSRVKNHFSQPSYRDDLFISKINRIGIIETHSEIEALFLESQLIKKHQPDYNVVWRDDKKYFYAGVTLEEFPRIFITHQPSLALNSAMSTKPRAARYVGPFMEGRALKKVLRLLRRVFPYYAMSGKLAARTHFWHGPKPCQYCHIGLCPGPNPDKKIYRQNIKKLLEVLRGKKNPVLHSIEKEMKEASKKQEFERATELRDQFFSLRRVMEHASLFSPHPVHDETSYAIAEEELKAIFHRKFPIIRIEAYDISNIQGKSATGSMPVFIDGNPAKAEYRKFKVRFGQEPASPTSLGGPNDFAMMKEVISRRLNHPEWQYPDLIIIDGGKGQLNAAMSAMRNFQFPISNGQQKFSKRDIQKIQDISIGALAKRQNELFLPGKKESILLSSLQAPSRNLIMHIRDEAHRFAITYHRLLRKKSLLK